MSTYRYVTTNVLTGQLQADSVPLHVQSFNRALSGTGTLAGYMDLTPLTAKYLPALEPRRTLLWALADGWPVWVGPIWDWPVSTMLTSGAGAPGAVTAAGAVTAGGLVNSAGQFVAGGAYGAGGLPLAVQSIESLFVRRQIRTALTFNAVDYFEVVRTLLLYATGQWAPKGVAVKQNATVAGLVLPTTMLGATVTTSYAAADQKDILGAITDLATEGNFEFTFEPVLLPGNNLAIELRLGTPRLGQLLGAGGSPLTFPGNVYDYGWPRMGSASLNSIVATAPTNSSSAGTWTSNTGAGHGVDATDLANGYPLLEGSVQDSGAAVTVQGQIDQYADSYVQITTRAPTVPTIVLGAGAPGITALGLGDQAPFTATSVLHPARADGSPGIQQVVRVIGWQQQPADVNQIEMRTLTLGDITT